MLLPRDCVLCLLWARACHRAQWRTAAGRRDPSRGVAELHPGLKRHTLASKDAFDWDFGRWKSEAIGTEFLIELILFDASCTGPVSRVGVRGGEERGGL